MLIQTIAWILLTAACSSLGIVGIAWCRHGHTDGRHRWGRRLVLGTLFLLGGIGFIAAFDPHSAVTYFGMAAALLVMGLIWEAPRTKPDSERLVEEMQNKRAYAEITLSRA